jgi:tetratricopeptide (TPR) repeat protein
MGNAVKGQSKFYKKPTRVLAVFLAVILLLTTIFTSSALASLITIRTSDKPDDAAVNYLARNNEYIDGNLLRRASSYLGTMGPQRTLRDYYSLTCTYIASERYSEALDSLEKCIRLYDNEGLELLTDLWLKKGCLLVMLEEYDEALAALDRVLEIDSTIPDAYLVKAQIYASLELYQEMCENLEYYLALNPDDQSVALLLEQVREELNSGTADNISAEAQTKPQGPSAESEYLKGLYAMQDEEFELAEAALSQAISFDGSYEGVYYYRGVCRLSLENYSGATEDFTESINSGYMVHSSYYNRGISQIMADEYEEGQKDVKFAAELDEDQAIKSRAENFLVEVEEAQNEARRMQYLSKAQLCSELNDMAGVCENLEAYLKESPEDIITRTALAQARFANEEYKKALEQYVIILKTDKTAENEYLYGITALQLSEFSLAEKALTRSIAIEDSCLNVYYYRGVCRLSLENYKGAVDDFTSSILSESMVQSSLFNRGISYLMMEKNDLGSKDVRAAADMNDDAEIKKQALQLLKDIKQ